MDTLCAKAEVAAARREARAKNFIMKEGLEGESLTVKRQGRAETAEE